QLHLQCAEIHRTGRNPGQRAAPGRYRRGRIRSRRYGHRHRKGRPGAGVRGVRADPQRAPEPGERHGPGPAAVPAPGDAARRHDRAAERARRGLDVFGQAAPALWQARSRGPDPGRAAALRAVAPAGADRGGRAGDAALLREDPAGDRLRGGPGAHPVAGDRCARPGPARRDHPRHPRRRRGELALARGPEKRPEARASGHRRHQRGRPAQRLRAGRRRLPGKTDQPDRADGSAQPPYGREDPGDRRRSGGALRDPQVLRRGRIPGARSHRRARRAARGDRDEPEADRARPESARPARRGSPAPARDGRGYAIHSGRGGDLRGAFAEEAGRPALQRRRGILQARPGSRNFRQAPRHPACRNCREPHAMMRTVLNVDDTAANRYLKSRALRQAGFRVVEAGTGQSALALVLEERPDLVLLDIKLPDMSGLEVCRVLKSDPKTEHIPIVHISATFVSEEAKSVSMESGAEVYLAEPVGPHELTSTVRTVMRLRETERTLAESEERMRLATQGAGIATWEIVVSPGDSVWSPQFYALLGCDPEATPASLDSWLARARSDEREVVAVALGSALKRTGSFALEHWI